MPKAADAAPATSSVLAIKKAAGQRLFNVVIVALLLIALAIISVLAFRGGQPAAEPVLAGGQNAPTDELESLSDIHVPGISTSPAGQPQAPNAQPQQASAGQSSQTDSFASGQSLSPQLSRKRPASTTGAKPGLMMDAADLAKKPSPSSAQVQLGTPIPMAGSASTSLVGSHDSSTQGASLPLTTPRYETVSTPSSAGGASSTDSSPNTGASPALYDGAKKPADQKNNANPERMIPGSNDPEMSLIPSAYTSSSAKTIPDEPVATKSTGSLQSDSLGVMVGAGMTEPEFPRAQATATPDFDVAAISSKFLEYNRQKSVAPASTGTDIVNPYAPSTPAAGTSVPATTVSTGGYSSAAYQQSPASAGVPYGTTGTTLTPYVRNSPTGAAPSGLGTGGADGSSMLGGAVSPASAAMQTPYPTANQAATTAAAYQQQSVPSGSAGYSTGYSMPSSGFGVPPRSANPSQMTAGATATAPPQAGAYGYPAGQNYGYAAGAGNSAATAGGSAAYRPSAVTSSNPYPGGQAPQGMIGQSGFATAPSGDVMGGAPTPVTGTMGYSTSPTR